MSTATIEQKAGVNAERAPFFLVLERIGRRVLRPGGRAATRRLLQALEIGGDDAVVELAAGVGATAAEILTLGPASYVAIEPEMRFAPQLGAVLEPAGGRHLAARAQDTGLSDACAHVVVGEAVLSMQPAARREEILSEAVRILRPGGRYGLHEIAATTDDPSRLDVVRHDLSRATKVNAAPPPVDQWCDLLAGAGLEVRVVETFPSRFLTVHGFLADEGVRHSLVIAARLLRWPQGWRRIRRTRRALRRHGHLLRAIVVVAERPALPPPPVPA